MNTAAARQDNGLAGVRVNTDRFAPRFPQGSSLIFSTVITPQAGQTVVAVVPGTDYDIATIESLDAGSVTLRSAASGETYTLPRLPALSLLPVTHSIRDL